MRTINGKGKKNIKELVEIEKEEAEDEHMSKLVATSRNGGGGNIFSRGARENRRARERERERNNECARVWVGVCVCIGVRDEGKSENRMCT